MDINVANNLCKNARNPKKQLDVRIFAVQLCAFKVNYEGEGKQFSTLLRAQSSEKPLALMAAEIM